MNPKCPNCSTIMAAETAHGVRLEVCPNCGGIWLSSDELKALLTGDPKAVADIEASIHTQVEQQHVGQSKLLCPIHQVLMDEYHYLYSSPVLVHSCSECGGMFIHGEDLPLMLQWYEKSTTPPSKEESMRIAMASDVAQHEAFMMRQQHLLSMFSTLRGFRPGWYGLWL